jgi:potassium-transporting ATPase potassium-binding subunit
MLIFSLVSCLFTYAILRLQQYLPLNPQKFDALSPHLAFNTAVSFTTNTNWQSYGGESTMSYLSQMVALAIHNFFSAAVGIAVAAALVRGIARHTAQTIGNFWVDVTRIIITCCCRFASSYALFLVSQGMIQNFKPYTTAKLIEPANRFRPKNRCERQTGGGCQGQSGDGEPDTRHADHRARADGVADRHQDARHQRRRLHQRQRRASV